MGWIDTIRKAIKFMEDNLENDISAQDVADQVYLSQSVLQRMFSVMTDYGIVEYIRNRRLYQAAIDLRKTDDKVIDIALRYCYETPESFSKAFARFHGVTPSQVREGATVKMFLPLKISVSIKGGIQMEHTINRMPSFRIIGFCQEYYLWSENEEDKEDADQEIPCFWEQITEKYLKKAYSGKAPENAIEKAVIDNRIGEYGLWVNYGLVSRNYDLTSYIIGGMYMGGEVPEGMVVYEVPKCNWAVFPCVGPLPDSMIKLNKQLHEEWIPDHPEFWILDSFCSFERFNLLNLGRLREDDYRCELWYPKVLPDGFLDREIEEESKTETVSDTASE